MYIYFYQALLGCLHSLLHFQLKALRQLFLKRCPPCPTTFHSVCPISPVFGSLHAITTYYLQNTELIQSYTCIMICRERKDRSLPWAIYIVEITLFSSPFPNTIITPPLASNLISGCSFSLSRKFWLSLTFTIFFLFYWPKVPFSPLTFWPLVTIFGLLHRVSFSCILERHSEINYCYSPLSRITLPLYFHTKFMTCYF